MRVAAEEHLIEIRRHAFAAADEEGLTDGDVLAAVRVGKAVSKDVDPYGPRKVGINFERTLRDRRRIRVKVSWDRLHYTVTVHTI